MSINGKWFEVFRTGRQTASNGSARDWTEGDLDTIVAKYNGQKTHEAPLVVGHPEHNTPAMGWVEELKRDGQILLAKAKDALPEFSDLVQKRIYPKRSISLYPDMTLRHIGFLGGMPPAIKGLADIQFKSGEQPLTYEFADETGRSPASRLLELCQEFAAIFRNPGTDQAIITHEENEMKQEEVEALITKTVLAATKQIGEQVTSFAESTKKLTEEVAGLRKQIGDGETASARRELEQFCESDAMKARITPAQRPAIVAHMLTLRGLEPVEFDDGKGGKVKKSQLKLYQENLMALPETVQFGEFATGDRVGSRGGEVNAVELAQKVTSFMESESKAGRTVTYAEALVHVEADMKGGNK